LCAASMPAPAATARSGLNKSQRPRIAPVP
jgi:hypothetical protein